MISNWYYELMECILLELSTKQTEVQLTDNDINEILDEFYNILLFQGSLDEINEFEKLLKKDEAWCMN